jgi:hypothetical protein
MPRKTLVGVGIAFLIAASLLYAGRRNKGTVAVVCARQGPVESFARKVPMIQDNLLHQVILDNIARYHCDPCPAPWHVELDTGKTRVACSCDKRGCYCGSVHEDWTLAVVTPATQEGEERLAELDRLYRIVVGCKAGRPSDPQLPSNWYVVTTGCQVPHAAAVGSYGQTYVYVMPENLDALRQLAHHIRFGKKCEACQVGTTGPVAVDGE